MPEEYLEEDGSLEDLEPMGEPTLMQEYLQKTPWWAISMAFHAVIMLILWSMNFGIGNERRVETFIEAKLEKQEEPEYDPEKERDLVKRDMPVTDAETVDVEPVVVTEEVEIDDHFETDDNELTESAKGQEDAVGFLDAGGTGFIGTIGVGGGGAAGRYGSRFGGKKNAVRRHGGGKGTESAVVAGLRWLARHQSADGAWHPDTWSNECPSGDSCVGKGGGQVNDKGKNVATAISGYALLAYLGAGHTHLRGDFKQTVKRCLDYMQKVQGADGKMSGGNLYTHGIASLSIVEAYGMTRSSRLKGMAQKAIDYMVNVQNPLGGWNYSSPSDRNDMSVAGWQIMALKSGKIGGLNVPDKTIKRVIRYLDIATNESSGSVAYVVTGNNPNQEYPGGGGSIRMRAAGALCHLFFGKQRNDPVLQKMGDVFLTKLPAWPPGAVQDKIKDVDLYYWYYATLVNFQLGGKYWKKWNIAMKDALLKTQLKGKMHADGSWPPVDQYSNSWSRPGITALCVLTLEVYYRYLPLYAK